MYNNHTIIGRLGKTPELSTLPSGASATTISVATNYSYKKDNEKVEETDWHTVVIYGKLAEICVNLAKKGSQVFVSGRHKYREVLGKDDEYPRKYSEIVADRFYLLGNKADESASKIPF